MSENQDKTVTTKEVVLEDVLQMLEDGKTRKEIGTHYGLNGAQTKELFKHEQLKGKRTKKAKVPPFKVVTREEVSTEGDINESEEEAVTATDNNVESSTEEAVATEESTSSQEESTTEDTEDDTPSWRR